MLLVDWSLFFSLPFFRAVDFVDSVEDLIGFMFEVLAGAVSDDNIRSHDIALTYILIRMSSYSTAWSSSVPLSSWPMLTSTMPAT